MNEAQSKCAIYLKLLDTFKAEGPILKQLFPHKKQFQFIFTMKPVLLLTSTKNKTKNLKTISIVGKSNELLDPKKLLYTYKMQLGKGIY